MVTLGQIIKNKKRNKKQVTYINLFDLNLLRGWKREQLKILKKLATSTVVSQAMMANASGTAVRTPELGGKLTALTRADLMLKAGKDKDGQFLWQLNEEKVEKKTLKDFLEKLDI